MMNDELGSGGVPSPFIIHQSQLQKARDLASERVRAGGGRAIALPRETPDCLFCGRFVTIKARLWLPLIADGATAACALLCRY